MPRFYYTAIDTNGKQKKGSLLALDAGVASNALREQGLFVVNLGDADSGNGLSKSIDFSSLDKYFSVPNQALIFYFKQLSFMLRAGLPVVQALQMSETQSHGRLRWTLGEMIKDIENGSSLSKAMDRHRDVFSPLSINLMMAGENTGELDKVASRLAEHLEKRAAIKAQTINAMIYPSVVVLVAIGVVIFLVGWIVPKFAKFLKGRGKKLPDSTQFLIDVSDFALRYGLAILGVIVVTVIGLVMFYKTPQGRLLIDGVLLRIPVIGKLLSHGATAELTWSLAMMMRSGLTAFEALKIASNVIGNRLISNKLSSASQLILSGKDLSNSLRSKAIPDLVTQMTAVGEKTGTLDHVLHELGVFYSEQLQIGVKRMSAMIEPAMIVVIGVLVGFVYYAFFQALFSLVSKG